MEKHLATIEYIKDILDEEDLNITFKKGKYVIKYIIDAKNSTTIEQLTKLKVIGKREKALSKLSIYFPKELFKIVMETINEPKPKFMMTDTYSPRLHKILHEGSRRHMTKNMNTTDSILRPNNIGIYSTTGTDIILPNSY
jgi:hypothetical protein